MSHLKKVDHITYAVESAIESGHGSASTSRVAR